MMLREGTVGKAVQTWGCQPGRYSFINQTFIFLERRASVSLDFAFRIIVRSQEYQMR